MLTLVFCTALFPALSYAQSELVPDTVTYAKAKVMGVTDERRVIIPGTETETNIQTLSAEILEGPEKGALVTFENDYIQLAKGDTFYLRHQTNSLEGSDYYVVSDPYRLHVLLGVILAFLVLLFMFGGLQGVRGLASLVGSIVLIFLFLIPGILGGYSPVLVSIGVSSLIIIVGSYITHGFNKTTTAAVFGMLATVVATGLAAYWAVDAAHLSGYASDESVYLNFDTRGSISMVGLLFGGIMIGLLGVLYDIAIGQAIAVEELYKAGAHLSRADVYRRALRIGREHIGALVNTLAIAYVGAALPLLLLISNSFDGDFLFTLNNELFATEIIRICVGAIGLILAVPATTFIASYMLVHLRERRDSNP